MHSLSRSFFRPSFLLRTRRPFSSTLLAQQGNPSTTPPNNQQNNNNNNNNNHDNSNNSQNTENNSSSLSTTQKQKARLGHDQSLRLLLWLFYHYESTLANPATPQKDQRLTHTLPFSFQAVSPLDPINAILKSPLPRPQPSYSCFAECVEDLLSSCLLPSAMGQDWILEDRRPPRISFAREYERLLNSIYYDELDARKALRADEVKLIHDKLELIRKTKRAMMEHWTSNYYEVQVLHFRPVPVEHWTMKQQVVLRTLSYQWAEFLDEFGDQVMDEEQRERWRVGQERRRQRKSGLLKGEEDRQTYEEYDYDFEQTKESNFLEHFNVKYFTRIGFLNLKTKVMSLQEAAEDTSAKKSLSFQIPQSWWSALEESASHD